MKHSCSTIYLHFTWVLCVQSAAQRVYKGIFLRSCLTGDLTMSHFMLKQVCMIIVTMELRMDLGTWDERAIAHVLYGDRTRL